MKCRETQTNIATKVKQFICQTVVWRKVPSGQTGGPGIISILEAPRSASQSHPYPLPSSGLSSLFSPLLPDGTEPEFSTKPLLPTDFQLAAFCL